MALAVMEADSKSGRNGWNENQIKKMELDDEAMEDMMEKLKSGIKTPTGAGNEPKITESVLEGLRKTVART